jgi:hypothetical protein
VRIAEWRGRRVVEKYAKKYDLGDEDRRLLASRVNDAAIFKERELWEKRLGVELAAIAGTSAVSALAGLALGLIALPGVGVLALSALFGSLISIGLSSAKLRSHLEGMAYSTVRELGLAASGEDPRSKKALGHAEKITNKYAERYKLDERERTGLLTLLESLALLKEKELWDKRLVPTLVAPVARGGGVAAVASMTGLVGPPTAAALVLGAVAESAVSGVLLYKKLDQALEGAAYAFVLGRGDDALLMDD